MVVQEKEINGGTQVIHKFDNNYGGSVVQHSFSYGGDKGLWEIAVIKFTSDTDWGITYSTPITSDVLGELTDAEVQEALKQIKALPS